MKTPHFFVRLLTYLMTFALLPVNSCCATEPQKYNLNEVLSAYGFVEEAQQDAFRSICEKAGVKLPQTFGTNEILKLVADTQKNLVNRVDKQERWETTDLSWMTANSTSLQKEFHVLGFIDELIPQKKNFDAVGVLGARMSAMDERLKFVESLVARGYSFDKVVLLTGERYATPGVDASKEKLEEIAHHFGIDSEKLTETYLFKYLYEKSSLNQKFELVVINTPQRDGRRPTTQTTVEDFCDWAKIHEEVKSVLFISGQPHVLYQKAIVTAALSGKASEISPEFAGHRTLDVSSKTCAGALGSFIWAYTPTCLRKLGLTVETNDDFALTKQLYGQARWLYEHFPKKVDQ